MTDELSVLAQAGAATLVAAMATDLWQSTRDSVLGLFRRDDPSRTTTIEAQLDGNAVMMREATNPQDVRQALFGLWALELESLLRRDPSCRGPLYQLTTEVNGDLPADRRVFVQEQHNSARDSGTMMAVQYGDLHAYRPADTGPCPPLPDRPSSSNRAGGGEHDGTGFGRWP